MSEIKCCYCCSYYRPYYTKGNIKFDRCDIGWCGKYRKTVEKHESCEFFGRRHYMRCDRRQSALAALTEHVNALAEIKQILEEDDKDALEAMIENLIIQRRK